MNRQALRTELDAGHPVTGTYDADAVVAAEQYNAVNRTRVRAITITEFREWLAENARAESLHVAQTEGSTPQVKSLARIGMSTMNSGTTGLDPSNPVHVAMVNELVADGVWTADDRAALIAKATVSISRGDELGTVRARAGDVQQARAL